MNSTIQTFLNNRGYKFNSTPFDIIEVCDQWYSNSEIEDFHVRKTVQGETYHLNRLNMAKRACSDDANLCEIISVSPEKEAASTEFINEYLNRNHFDTRYREQLEKVSASGTACAYTCLENATYYDDDRVRGGEVKIVYVDSQCFIPLTINNGEVTECAFYGENIEKGKKQIVLVIFTLDDNKNYVAETVIFNDNGNVISDQTLQLGDVKPFAIMKNAEVNNLDDMNGYGLPKIWNSIPFFKAIDLCFNVLFSDLDKGEKLILLNELLCEFDDDGKPKLSSAQKKLFMLLGEKLPDQKDVYQEYNPEIRVDNITKTFELLLSFISMTFGYGTKKYTFENGQIKTATEYAGERADSMQELNKQRKQSVQYIESIIRSALWFQNNFNGTSYDIDEALSIQFDDSFVEDKTTKLDGMRADALSFPEYPYFLKCYIKEKYNLSDDEVEEVMKGAASIEEDEPLD